jgi:hypothetical protein
MLNMQSQSNEFDPAFLRRSGGEHLPELAHLVCRVQTATDRYCFTARCKLVMLRLKRFGGEETYFDTEYNNLTILRTRRLQNYSTRHSTPPFVTRINNAPRSWHLCLPGTL